MADTQSKRRRLGSPYELKKRRRKEANGGSKAVGIDALPWGQAKLPDRLDDAEGFFGLEEISDVEVVRDPTSGRVEYRVGEASSGQSPQGFTADFPSCLDPLTLLTLRADIAWRRTAGAASANQILGSDPPSRRLHHTYQNRPQHRLRRGQRKRDPKTFPKAMDSMFYETTLSMTWTVCADALNTTPR